jgi:hypothetical protein
MSCRGLLLFGISQTGPFGLKLTPQVDETLSLLFQGNSPQSLPLSVLIQGKRKHLEAVEVRFSSEGLELFVRLKKLPNMIQDLLPDAWIPVGVVKNPTKILQISGILQTKKFQQIVEETLYLAPNEWNAPIQDLEFVEFLGSFDAYIPESC